MNLLYLLLFVGSVLSSAISYVDLIADIELNLYLIKDIISKSDGNEKLTSNLRNLETALTNYSFTLYHPQVMVHFCGNIRSNNQFYAKLLNKYQIDTVNPFAEVVNYKLLDESKFLTPFKKETLNLNAIKSNSALLAEFESLIQRDVKMFSNPYRQIWDLSHIRTLYKPRIEKFIIRNVREYVKANGISAPGIESNNLYTFECALKVYINNGNE